MTPDLEARRWLSALLLAVFFLPFSATAHLFAVLLSDSLHLDPPGLGEDVAELAAGSTATEVRFEVQATPGESATARHIDDVPAGAPPTPPPQPEPEPAPEPAPSEAQAAVAMLVTEEPELEPEVTAREPTEEAEPEAEPDEPDEEPTDDPVEAEPPDDEVAEEPEEEPEAAPESEASDLSVLMTPEQQLGAEPSRAILGAAGLGGDAENQEYRTSGGGVCPDRYEGTWVAQRYDPRRAEWIRFRVRISRSGDRLRGTISNRSWSGPRSRRSPPEYCHAFTVDRTYRMPATGHVDGDRMEIRGGPASLVRDACPHASTSFGTYYPDRFTGTVDALGLVFEAINNDGEVEIDQGYRFRRVACDP